MSQAVARLVRHTPTPAKRETVARSSRRHHAPSHLAMQAGARVRLGTHVQPKLDVNRPGDRFEREADATADRVMRAPAATTEEEERASVEDVAIAQNPRQVQRAGEGASAPRISASTASTISNPGPGQPLSPAMRRRIEPHVGANLGGVRVHEGPRAARAALSLQARAFTHGPNIFLGPRESASDTRLIAHEATHTVQQGAAPIRRMEAEEETLQPALAMEEEAAVQRTLMAVGEEAVQRAVAPPEEETVQRVVEPASETPEVQRGILGDIIDGIAELTTDTFWALLEEVAPRFVPILRRILDRGIFGYLKDLIGSAFDSLFSGLTADGGLLSGLMETFGNLFGAAQEILGALASGDCQPLFDAVGRLMETVQQIAGDAWNAIVDFFEPIGTFFSDLWQSFGAPVVDWLTQFAGDVWQAIQDLGREIWDLTEPVRDALSAAWDWVKDLLGIGGESAGGGNSEGGILGWLRDVAGEVWTEVTAFLEPVIGPIRSVAERIIAILPLDAIMSLRDTVRDWLSSVGSMAQNAQQPQGVVENQRSLRSEILPAVLATIQNLRGSLIGAGMWVAMQIGSLAATVSGFMESLRSNPILSVAAGAIEWIQSGVTSLAEWAQNTVTGLFTLIGDGLVRLSRFVEPLLGVLQKVVSVIGDVVGELPGLVLGPVWRLIPACIREPIKNFVIEHILRNIPIINRFLNIPDVWARIQNLVMSFLRQVFVNGDLSGAVMTVIRFVLEAAGVNVDLLLRILSNAANSLVDIIMNPVGFLSNLFGALQQGLGQFVNNIGRHLINGLLTWLLGPLQDLGVTPPRDLSLTSILDLVLQIMGISGSRLRQKAERLIGRENVRLFSEAWRWISSLISGGLGGLWQEIQQRLSDLWDTIIGGLTQWISIELVEVGVQRLIMMSNPVGAVLEAIRTIYNVVSFFVERINQILELVNTVVNSIGQIAVGAIGSAANWIEDAMARTIPTILNFLADLIDIDNPAPTIRRIVTRIQERVDQALDWLVERAVQLAQRVAGALGLGGGPGEAGADSETVVGETIPFDAAGGSHRLWIHVAGSQATVMVSSDEAPLTVWLTRMEQQIDNLPVAQRSSASSLIAQARAKLGETDQEADRAAQAQSSATGSTSSAASAGVSSTMQAEIVADENDLATIMRSLFDMFLGQQVYPIYWPTQLPPPTMTEFENVGGGSRDETYAEQLNRMKWAWARRLHHDPEDDPAEFENLVIRLHAHHVVPLFLGGAERDESNVIFWERNNHLQGHANLRDQPQMASPPGGLPPLPANLYNASHRGKRYRLAGYK